MIHRFSIENFYSIREEQVVDLVLPRTTPELPRFPASHADETIRLPTVIALFGANASGKTNVLRALTGAVDFAVNSFNLAPDAALSPFQPFRAKDWRDRPTRIVVDFDAAWLGGWG